MKDIQVFSLAYEVVSIMDDLNFNLAEAMQEIQEVLESDYKRELLAEVNEDLCYYYEHVLSDILSEIKKVVEQNMGLVLN